MLVSALKTQAEVVAERTIPDATYLIACQETVRIIESRDHRITNLQTSYVDVDGSSFYDLSTAITGFDRRRVVRVNYVLDDINVELIEMDGLEPPSVGNAAGKVLYYDWYGIKYIQLNANPTEGQLAFDIKMLPDQVATSTDVPYPPLLMGSLYWLAANVWGDTRKDDWHSSFEEQLNAFVKETIWPTSQLNNERE